MVPACERRLRKKQKSSERAFAAPGLYPPPGTSPNCCLLVERVERQDARFGVGANAGRVDANHCIFLSAETANAGLVDRERNRLDRVANELTPPTTVPAPVVNE